jgi:hypothetical protein
MQACRAKARSWAQERFHQASLLAGSTAAAPPDHDTAQRGRIDMAPAELATSPTAVPSSAAPGPIRASCGLVTGVLPNQTGTSTHCEPRINRPVQLAPSQVSALQKAVQECLAASDERAFEASLKQLPEVTRLPLLVTDSAIGDCIRRAGGRVTDLVRQGVMLDPKIHYNVNEAEAEWAKELRASFACKVIGAMSLCSALKRNGGLRVVWARPGTRALVSSRDHVHCISCHSVLAGLAHRCIGRQLMVAQTYTCLCRRCLIYDKVARTERR